VDLARDLLDKAVVDRHGHPMGRVDNLVLRMHARKAPQLVGIEIGLVVLAERLNQHLARWVRTIERFTGMAPGQSVRLRLDDVRRVGRRVELGIEDTTTAANAVEFRLREWLGGAATATGTARAVPRLHASERRFASLLGTVVLDDKGQRIGRLEELTIDDLHGDASVSRCWIGRRGWLERFGLAAGAIVGEQKSGLSVAWDEVSFQGGATHAR